MLLIYGKGKVGHGVASLCEYLGISYDIKDDRDRLENFDQYHAIIPSPGIRPSHPIYTTGKIFSELDFAYQYLPKNFTTISVTGTDGKSTTAWILYNILQKEFFGKKSVYISGNFDIPFSHTVREILERGEKSGYIVLEVSSFMSYAIKLFTTDYTIYTNIKPDHLDWHKNLEDYYDAKMRLVIHTTKKVVASRQVYNFGKEHRFHISPLEGARFFDLSEDKAMRDRTNGEDIILSTRRKYKLSETPFSGSHNAMNILASTMIANELGICSKRIRNYLTSISGLPHRLEKIGEKNGVLFVEDSKSTSSQSLEAALGSYGEGKNLLLIVGGSDKGDSFEHLSPLFQKRVKGLVCMGATKEKFAIIAKKENIDYILTDNLYEGIDWLYSRASYGDVLMLSPGCASFGLFRDYLDRANQFRSLVEKFLLESM